MDEAEEVPKLALGLLRSTAVCKEEEAQGFLGSSGGSERSRWCSVLVEELKKSSRDFHFSTNAR